MNKLSNFKKGAIAGIMALTCYSFIASFGIKVYQSGVSSVGLVLFRSMSAGLLLFLTILVSKKLSFKPVLEP